MAFLSGRVNSIRRPVRAPLRGRSRCRFFALISRARTVHPAYGTVLAREPVPRSGDSRGGSRAGSRAPWRTRRRKENPMRRSHIFLIGAVVVLGTFIARDAAAESTLFRRGDSNSDGVVDISDAIAVLHFLFSGGAEVSCADAADANDDGKVDLSDSVYDLLHLFAGGAAPPDPGSRCGADPSPDDLACALYEPCEG